MKHVTWYVYNLSDGVFTGRNFSANGITGTDLPKQMAGNVSAGCAAIYCATPPTQSQKVDLTTKKVVDYQPPQPSVDHVWDLAAKRWILSAQAAAKAKAKTDATLRITQLVSSQHDDVRRLTLNLAGVLVFAPGEGDAAAARLKAIDDEIAKLRAGIN